MRRIVTMTLAALLFAAAGAAGAERPAQAPGAAALATQAPRIDVNLATAAELLAVPGIGPKMAEEIVELRKTRGRFGSLEELLEVRGIKRKKLDAISPYLVVTAAGPPSPPAASR